MNLSKIHLHSNSFSPETSRISPVSGFGDAMHRMVKSENMNKYICMLYLFTLVLVEPKNLELSETLS
jgi:hypothetical protein